MLSISRFIIVILILFVLSLEFIFVLIGFKLEKIIQMKRELTIGKL